MGNTIIKIMGVGVVGMLLLTACRAEPKRDYARQLPPSASALRRLPVDQWPSFAAAFDATNGDLTEALQRSLDWYAKPSTKHFFPFKGITHEQASLSVFAVGQALGDSPTAAAFETWLRREFDVYVSIGWDQKGTVLFTGYYSPIFHASRSCVGPFKYPLYMRPADLVSDPITGQVLGRRIGQTHICYPARAAIESAREELGLVGRELVYLRDKLDAYLVHVNGSARLTMTDGTTMFIGYAGSNGHPYTSIGQLLVRDGRIPKADLSLATLRAYFQAYPQDLDYYTNCNERFIFFRQYPGKKWPAGSLGFKVTPWRSLATDKSIFPRGSVVLVLTRVPQIPNDQGHAVDSTPFSQFMLDQDTGGAIRAAGRADIYMGTGPQAEVLAGRQAAEGQLYYLFLKPKRLNTWRQKSGS